MNKNKRESVLKKYNGKCAYCGKDIELKSMQIDHAFPQSRKHWLEHYKMRELENLDFTDIDDFKNLMPACRRCNHYKRAQTVDEFRESLKTINERIMKNYIVKVGVDFGIVKIEPFDGKFFFEKFNGHRTGTNPEPGQDENSMMEYDKWSAINNPIKAGYVGTFKAGYKSGQTSRNAEIEALKAEIESMRDFLELVERWKDAYPEDVFPPIGKDSYFMMCKASGFSVDRVSAHVLRGIVKNYSDQATIILNKSQTQPRNNPPNKSNN